MRDSTSSNLETLAKADVSAIMLNFFTQRADLIGELAMEMNGNGPRTPVERERSEADKAEKRFAELKKVDLSRFVADLQGNDFALIGASARVSHGEYGGKYRLQFIFHRQPLMRPPSADVMTYLANRGAPKLISLAEEAMWDVEGLRNPLKDRKGFGWCFNCRNRELYFENGTRRHYRRERDPKTKKPIGEAVPITAFAALTFNGEHLAQLVQ